MLCDHKLRLARNYPTILVIIYNSRAHSVYQDGADFSSNWQTKKQKGIDD